MTESLPTPTDAFWSPTALGRIHVAHRVAMAPMTRSRATRDGLVTDLTRTYYAQRASLAMRVSHVSNTPHGRTPLGPSAIAARGDMFTASGPQPMSTPREMTEADIAQTISDFRRAARLAVDAGADGVEVHGANGYLLQQFMSTNANRRTDRYGVDIAGRVRFPIEVAAAVAEEIGADRTGYRISPGSPLGNIEEADVDELYAALIGGLAPLGLAYLHVVHLGDEALLRRIRDDWPTGIVLNRAGADIERRAQDVRDGLADVVSFGTLALANPDLPARIRRGAEMSEPDRATLYGGAEHGYIDYPRLAA